MRHGWPVDCVIPSVKSNNTSADGGAADWAGDSVDADGTAFGLKSLGCPPGACANNPDVCECADRTHHRRPSAEWALSASFFVARGGMCTVAAIFAGILSRVSRASHTAFQSAAVARPIDSAF